MSDVKFKGPLTQASKDRIDASDEKLRDPARLDALRRTGLMDSPCEEAFDRLARLAARLLKVPLTIISLISDEAQFFKAAHGLVADSKREISIDGSICRFTLQGEPIIAADVTTDAILKYHPAVDIWKIAAFVALPMITKDGHVLGAFCAVDTKVRPWSEDDLFTLRELTASTMTEINLRLQVAELGIERELRERFVNTLTHDLRTPLSVIKTNAYLLARKSKSDPVLQRIAERIDRNVDRTDAMIRDLLDANALQAGQTLPLDFAQTDLTKLVISTVSELNCVHNDRFEVRSEGAIQGSFCAGGVQRLLENLCVNAVKYGAQDRPITVSLRARQGAAEIAVHNEGHPIPEEEQGGLFDAFRRTHSARQSAGSGWGLGLTLVKGIAEAHQGSVTVRSGEQDGTTFQVSLPLT